MDPWKLWFFLLLPLSFCTCRTGAQDLLVKIISEQPDFTPICSNETEKILFIVCWNSTEMIRGEEDCRLSYRILKGFQHDCGSKFSLVTINQTVFLQVNNLTAADSGILKCECSQSLGTHTLLLNFTVQEKENTTRSTETVFSDTVTGPTLLLIIIIIIIVISGGILGVFCRSLFHRGGHLKPVATRNSYDSTVTYTKTADVKPNCIGTQRKRGIYSVVRMCDIKKK